MKDYYRILEVIPEASPEVIRAAFRALMLKYHPDVKGDTEKTMLIAEAEEVLSDPDKKRDYDNLRRAAPVRAVGNYKILEMIALPCNLF